MPIKPQVNPNIGEMIGERIKMVESDEPNTYSLARIGNILTASVENVCAV